MKTLIPDKKDWPMVRAATAVGIQVRATNDRDCTIRAIRAEKKATGKITPK